MTIGVEDSWLQDYLVAIFRLIATQSNEPLSRFYLRESQEFRGDMLNSSCIISFP